MGECGGGAGLCWGGVSLDGFGEVECRGGVVLFSVVGCM